MNNQQPFNVTHSTVINPDGSITRTITKLFLNDDDKVGVVNNSNVFKVFRPTVSDAKVNVNEFVDVDKFTVLFTVSNSDINKTSSECNCSICLMDYSLGDVCRRLPCFHAFHSSCVESWLKMNKICPVCREPIG